MPRFKLLEDRGGRPMEGFFKVPVVTVGEWTTASSEATLRLYRQPPPRPSSHFTQFRVDARAYKPWVFWLGGAGLIALGFAILCLQPIVPIPGRAISVPRGLRLWLGWLVVAFGVWVLLVWFSKFMQAVHATRTAPLATGV